MCVCVSHARFLIILELGSETSQASLALWRTSGGMFDVTSASFSSQDLIPDPLGITITSRSQVLSSMMDGLRRR